MLKTFNQTIERYIYYYYLSYCYGNKTRGGKMKNISTGEPSTLKTYLKIAKVFGKESEDFIKDKIAKSPNGENEEVITDERQMIHLFGYMIKGKQMEVNK